jgi:hypothetical protein
MIPSWMLGVAGRARECFAVGVGSEGWRFLMPSWDVEWRLSMGSSTPDERLCCDITVGRRSLLRRLQA